MTKDKTVIVQSQTAIHQITLKQRANKWTWNVIPGNQAGMKDSEQEAIMAAFDVVIGMVENGE